MYPPLHQLLGAHAISSQRSRGGTGDMILPARAVRKCWTRIRRYNLGTSRIATATRSSNLYNGGWIVTHANIRTKELRPSNKTDMTARRHQGRNWQHLTEHRYESTPTTTANVITSRRGRSQSNVMTEAKSMKIQWWLRQYPINSLPRY